MQTEVAPKDSKLNMTTGLALVTRAKLDSKEQKVVYEARAEWAIEREDFESAKRYRENAQEA